MQPSRILIVDDDRNIQRMLRLCLEGSGYAVEQATDGALALEAIHRQPPDVVLLDLAMPVLDGMSVLADLRTILSATAMRVIVMTAHGSVRTAMQAVRLGAADFLEKPFRPEELRQSVASVLGSDTAGQADSVTVYGLTLQHVRDALRQGKFIAAEAALMKAGTISDCDPCFLNLAGVLHEAHGRQSSARNFYRKALAIDAGYRAASENLQRLDEIEQTGATRLEVALGDESGTRIPDASSAASSADRFRRILFRENGAAPHDDNQRK
jgi:CheY-like chemotaxis protein